MSTPISGMVNRTGLDLASGAGSTVAAAVARGLGPWLDGGDDAVVVLVDTVDTVAAPGLLEQAETMVVARSATTATVRPGGWRRLRCNDSTSA